MVQCFPHHYSRPTSGPLVPYEGQVLFSRSIFTITLSQFIQSENSKVTGHLRIYFPLLYSTLRQSDTYDFVLRSKCFHPIWTFLTLMERWGTVFSVSIWYKVYITVIPAMLLWKERKNRVVILLCLSMCGCDHTRSLWWRTDYYQSHKTATTIHRGGERFGGRVFCAEMWMTTRKHLNTPMYNYYCVSQCHIHIIYIKIII